MLLDTHIAFWLVQRPSLLLEHEVAALSAVPAELFVSAVSLWELRLKWQSLDKTGRRKGPIDPGEALKGFTAYGLKLVPLEAEQAAAPLRDPLRHKDPFDELLLAQAASLNLLLLTRDANLLGHPQAYRPLT